MDLLKYFRRPNKKKKNDPLEIVMGLPEERRSPKEIIEERRSVEHFYVKFPGENLTEASIEGSNKKDRVKLDVDKVELMLKERKRGTYSNLHTHPNDLPGAAYPSYDDIKNFLTHDKAKTMWIAQQNQETGKVEGYFCLRKTSKTPKFKSKERVNRDFSQEMHESVRIYDLNSGRGEFAYGLDYVTKKHNLKFRFIPSRGYSLDTRIDKSKFVKKPGLEERIELSIIGALFLSSLLFLSSNITGYAVARTTSENSNLIGMILLFLGILGVTGYILKIKKK